MKSKHLSLAAAIAVASTSALISSPGHAQARTLDEIVVTARKREESIQDIPVSVTAVSGEELAARNIVQMSDVLAISPNANIQVAQGNPTSLRMTIRGQTVSDILLTLDPAIGVYNDGFYLARPDGAATDMLDVERVEVLRGPQGTLFGRNTTGGALNITTVKPVHELEGSVKGRVGNYGRRDLEGVLNLPLVADQLALRVAASTLNYDGFGDNKTTNEDVPSEDSEHFLGKLLWTPTDSFELLLKADIQDMTLRDQPIVVNYYADNPAGDNTRAYIAGLSGGSDSPDNYRGDVIGDIDTIFQDVDPVSELESKIFSATAIWDLDAFTVKFLSGYRELDRVSQIDLDGTPYPVMTTETRLNDYENFSAELQVLGTALDGSLEWVTGVMYFTEEGNEGSTTALGSVPSLGGIGVISNFDGDITNDAVGAFAQATYALSEDLSVTGGLRYSKDEKELISRNSSTIPLLAMTVCSVPSSGSQCRAAFDLEDDSIDYLLSLDYQLTPDVMVFARTTTGYKSGGHQLRGSGAFFTPADPEEVTDYEVGFKADLAEGSLRVNGALFYTEYENIHRSALVFINNASATLLVNAAEGTVQGGELEISWLPTDKLQLGATLGYTDATYDQYDDLDASGNTVDRSGEKFLSVPEMTYTLSAAYTQPTSFGALLARLDYIWRDEMITGSYVGSNDPTTVLATELGLLNGRVTVEMDNGLDLSLFGRNLTDEREPVVGLDITTTTGWSGSQWSRPREYGLEAVYRF